MESGVNYVVTVHEIAVDGLPEMSDDQTGRIAFFFNGCVVSGWPLPREKFPNLYSSDLESTLWEADSDVGAARRFAGVTHWIEFPVPVWSMK
jgi:hypothetical protein